MAATLLRIGQAVEGYLVVDQAPAALIRGSSTRAIEGHMIAGSWSEPWWLYSPDLGWAIAKRWKNRQTRTFGPGGTGVTIASRDEIVIESWKPEGTDEQA
jgi:hypothetical protein